MYMLIMLLLLPSEICSRRRPNQDPSTQIKLARMYKVKRVDHQALPCPSGLIKLSSIRVFSMILIQSLSSVHTLVQSDDSSPDSTSLVAAPLHSHYSGRKKDGPLSLQHQLVSKSYYPRQH
jgi:hypothetical protein